MTKTKDLKSERLTKPYRGSCCALKGHYVANLHTYVKVGPSEEELEWNLKSVDKLGKLEDIECELGISLEVLWKMIKEPNIYIYVVNNDTSFPAGIYKSEVTGISALCAPNQLILTCLMDKGQGYLWQHGVRVNEYGKVWALTKEELENK